MTALNQDLHEFIPDFFGTYHELRDCAATGRQEILLIACSDHGTAPDNLSFAETGQLVIVQNMAASIPRAGQTYGMAALGSIEYAIGLMNVQHAVVCSHLGCSIIPHWLKSRSGVSASEEEINEFHRQAKRVVDAEYPTLSPTERLQAITQEHTLFQVENLQSHDSVRKRLENARLHLHAWIVDDDTAKVTAYDPSDGQFHPL